MQTICARVFMERCYECRESRQELKCSRWWRFMSWSSGWRLKMEKAWPFGTSVMLH